VCVCVRPRPMEVLGLRVWAVSLCMLLQSILVLPGAHVMVVCCSLLFYLAGALMSVRTSIWLTVVSVSVSGQLCTTVCQCQRQCQCE
jgi:hypothetical protein